MEIIVASSIATMTGCGIYLILRAQSFAVILGLGLLSYATNVFIFSMGGLNANMPPIISSEATAYTDPLPQALVLTAIVISFGMTALIVVMALRAFLESGTDHVDLKEKSKGAHEPNFEASK